jgi:DNA-binding transcriptional ArsR family regulator
MTDRLTLTFQALADPTRRLILERLLRGEATVNELAEPLPMSQPAVSKHLKVLEAAGLVERRQDAQRRWARVQGGPLREVALWTTEFQRLWDERFVRLDGVLKEEKAKARRRLSRR